MTQTFIQNAFILKWYNGKPIDVFDIPYMSDATSFRIGAVRLRQNRVPKGKLYNLFLLFYNFLDGCNVLPQMVNTFPSCQIPYSLSTEDKGTYTWGWQKKNYTKEKVSPWIYRGMQKIKGCISLKNINS